MSDPYADRTISRALLQEIRQDRTLMEEGHRFLDEMRVLLGQRLLVHIANYEAALRRIGTAQIRARQAMANAVLAGGLHPLQTHPAERMDPPEKAVSFENFLGVRLPVSQEYHPVAKDDSPEREIEGDEAVEIAELRDAMLAIMTEAFNAALETAAIFRLYQEYRRTDRRAQALENVLLPELHDAERHTEEVLEAVDLEEAVQIRLAGVRASLLRGH